MATKRSRFGLVFNGTRPPPLGGEFLKELDIIKADGCERDGEHFLVFSTNKPRRPTDVLNAIETFNASAPEKMNLVRFEDSPEVVVFERGNCFRTHPVCKIIQSAVAQNTAWSWSTMVDVGGKKRRVISELESDLVESSIRPSLMKRAAVRPTEVMIVSCVIGASVLCFVSVV